MFYIGLESCSGSFKFMGGFREVAQILDGNDTNPNLEGSLGGSSGSGGPHSKELNNSLDRKSIKSDHGSKELYNSAITNNINNKCNNAMTPLEDNVSPKTFYPPNPRNFFHEKQLTVGQTQPPTSAKIENADRDVFYTHSSSQPNVPEAPIGFRNNENI